MMDALEVCVLLSYENEIFQLKGQRFERVIIRRLLDSKMPQSQIDKSIRKLEMFVF